MSSRLAAFTFPLRGAMGKRKLNDERSDVTRSLLGQGLSQRHIARIFELCKQNPTAIDDVGSVGQIRNHTRSIMHDDIDDITWTCDQQYCPILQRIKL